MPSFVQNPSPGASANGILLVEEYGALAVAITAALKKFAPLHQVRVARSLPEAEAIASEMNPDLFLLDLDPPPAGDLEFLVKLQKRSPEARALVIAPGTSAELRAERGAAGAVQFIEKPFDLGEFGAAVQALLGPWATPPTDSFRGTLRDLHVVDVVQLKCLASSSAGVRLETSAGDVGEIHFRRGEIVHAATSDKTGVTAFEEIVRWSGGTISETEIPENAPRTIEQPWDVLLLQAVQKAAELKPAEARRPVATAAAAPKRPGKKILVIDDTEMLLIFTADILGTADPSLEILTAPSGRDGLAMAARVRPDLILLDYSLEDTTGAEVCRQLLMNETTARIPVLMMSGHLPELANTAATYGNVVATLPKPFLSGALIDEVEKTLAGGPLPRAPGVPPPPQPQLPAAAPESPPPVLPAPSAVPDGSLKVDAPAPPRLPPQSSLHNGNGNGQASKQADPPSPPAAIAVPAPPFAAPAPGVAFRVPPQMAPEGGAAASGSKDVSVTFSFEVLAMQLTPDFRMNSLRLAPAAPAVGVRVADGSEIGSLVETGFEMGPMQLTAAGTLGTILLIPTRQPPRLAAAGAAFAVSGVRAQTAAQVRLVELTAAKSETMRLNLTARFEFLTVELSPTFEVVAVVLRAREEPAQVTSHSGQPGTPFALEQAQLDATNRLVELVARAVR